MVHWYPDDFTPPPFPNSFLGPKLRKKSHLWRSWTAVGRRTDEGRQAGSLPSAVDRGRAENKECISLSTLNSQTMDRCGKKKQSTNVADPDPGSGAFLTPGSEIRNRFVLDPGFPNSFLGPKKSHWKF